MAADQPTPATVATGSDTADATHHAHVAPNARTPWYQQWSLWIMVGVGILLLMVVFSSQSKPANTPLFAKNTRNMLSMQELHANLAQLHTLAWQARHTLRPVEQHTPVVDREERATVTTTHAMKARENAPNSILSVVLPRRDTSAATPVGAHTLAGRGPYVRFADQTNTPSDIEATRITHPKTTLVMGEFIHAVLETAINSALPGEVRAVVSQPVYAYLGGCVLIPAGSRLIGQYDAAVRHGQYRIFVIWDTVILPNGVIAQLMSPGVDPLGRAGISVDSVNTHFFARFGEAALLSIIGAGVANVGVVGTTQYNSAADYRMNVAHAFQQSAAQSLRNTLPTQPTLQVNQGANITVFVAHEIDFYGVLSNKVTRLAFTPSSERG